MSGFPEWMKSVEQRLAEMDRRIRKNGSRYPDTDWFVPTLQNGYTNLDPANFDTFAICRRSDIVFIRGMLAGGTRTSGTLIFTLPPGYRPGGTVTDVRTHTGVSCAGDDTVGGGRINITTLSGLVTSNALGASWFSLSTLSFPAGA